MDPKISAEEKLKKVEDILVILGLTKTQDTLVGFPTGKLRGISGKLNYLVHYLVYYLVHYLVH